ncbi:MAG: hypothetical protein Q8S43_11345 [Actinomycetota bacterium]|nr:hypothetical protein [Actinomycetota bacterium]MDP3631528.1 hypothetical protein [Actinomycetota bacterium]
MSLQSAIESLRQLAQNPSSNLAATSLGFAIMVVVVLILILAVLMVFAPRSRKPSAKSTTPPEDDGGAPAADQDPRATSFLRQHRATFLAILALIAVGSAYVSSGTNNYCARTCHSMTSAGETWTASPHAKTACVRCHESSPVDAVATRTRHVIGEFTHASTSARRAAVSSRRCLGCHADILDATITSAQGIRVAHSHIIAAGADCMRCHVGIGHSKSTATRPGTMNDCLRCHDGAKALGACFICHEDRSAQAAKP